MLNSYLTAVQRLLGTGSSGNLYSTAELTDYINEARRQIAAEGQCIRALPPISGPITSIAVSSGGAGYGAVDVIIGGPDSPLGTGPFPNGLQATATAVTGAGGTITAITLQSAGTGYFAPAISFSGAGSGASAVATVSGIAQTTINQEAYAFSALNPLIATSGSGVESIYMVNGVSLIWGSYRYTLMHTGFQRYQAQIRVYQGNYAFVPAVFAQFNQGGDGTLYMYPVPNQAYQMEWDCCCIPAALATDADPEAIPYPWTDAVKYFAAYLALSSKQRWADADRMFNEYEKFMKRSRQFSSPRATTNWYGRG